MTIRCDQVEVQISDMLPSWAISLDSVVPHAVLDNERTNDSHAIKDMVLILDLDVCDVFDVLLWKNHKVILQLPKRMFDCDAPVRFLRCYETCGRRSLNAGGGKQPRKVIGTVARVTV